MGKDTERLIGMRIMHTKTRETGTIEDIHDAANS